MKKNWKNAYQTAHKFLLVHDFVQMKLTDEFVTDYSNASRTMLFDINEQNWSNVILNELDIPKEKLPKAMPSGKKISGLTKKAAEETGLPEGLPIVTGGGDQQCAALGVGVSKEGRVKADFIKYMEAMSLEETRKLDEVSLSKFLDDFFGKGKGMTQKMMYSMQAGVMYGVASNECSAGEYVRCTADNSRLFTMGYPHGGTGAIPEAYCEAIQENGRQLITGKEAKEYISTKVSEYIKEAKEYSGKKSSKSRTYKASKAKNSNEVKAAEQEDSTETAESEAGGEESGKSEESGEEGPNE